MIEIYGKDHCPFCVKAKQLCEIKGVEYTYKTMGKDFTREELLEQFPNARTVPQIRVDGSSIGGFNELQSHFASVTVQSH